MNANQNLEPSTIAMDIENNLQLTSQATLETRTVQRRRTFSEMYTERLQEAMRLAGRPEADRPSFARRHEDEEAEETGYRGSGFNLPSFQPIRYQYQLLQSALSPYDTRRFQNSFTIAEDTPRPRIEDSEIYLERTRLMREVNQRRMETRRSDVRLFNDFDRSALDPNNPRRRRLLSLSPYRYAPAPRDPLTTLYQRGPNLIPLGKKQNLDNIPPEYRDDIEIIIDERILFGIDEDTIEDMGFECIIPENAENIPPDWMYS